jgi:hypothetical protein
MSSLPWDLSDTQAGVTSGLRAVLRKALSLGCCAKGDLFRNPRKRPPSQLISDASVRLRPEADRLLTGGRLAKLTLSPLLSFRARLNTSRSIMRDQHGIELPGCRQPSLTIFRFEKAGLMVWFTSL